MEKILVSACLLGQPVRYNGQAVDWTPPDLWQQWQAERRLLPFCAKCAAGFGVPRPSAEQVRQGHSLRILEQTGRDVTEPFLLGARLALAIAACHAFLPGLKA